MIVTVPQSEKSEKTGKFNLILITFIASLGFLTNGTFVAWTSNFFQSETVQGEFTTEEISYIGSSLPCGGIFGSLIVLTLGNLFGRKIWFVFCSTLMIISWAMMPIINHFWIFIISRLMAGFAVGILHFLIPIYVMEISTIKFNQTLQNILYVQFAIGILIEYILGILFNPLVCLLISMVAPILFLIGTYFLPESPNILLIQGKESQAKKILQKFCHIENKNEIIINNTTTNITITNELDNEINKRIYIELSLIGLKSIFKTLFSSKMVPIIGLVILEQLTGSISIFFYLMNILHTIKSVHSSELISITVCILLVISIPIYHICSFNIKDKTVLKLSLFFMVLSLTILGTFRHMQSILGKPSDYGYIPLICFCIFILFYGIGPFRLTYHYVQAQTNELNCYKIRGISSCFTWITICLCTRLIPRLIQLIGVGWLTWYMAILCLITLMFTFIFVPDLQQNVKERKLLESGEISSEESSKTNSNSNVDNSNEN